MKNSEKAFEEWVYSKFEYVKERSSYFIDLKDAWEAGHQSAIEFAAKVCGVIEQEKWAKYKEDGNPHNEGQSDGAGLCGSVILEKGLS